MTMLTAPIVISVYESGTVVNPNKKRKNTNWKHLFLANNMDNLQLDQLGLPSLHSGPRRHAWVEPKGMSYVVRM